MRKDDRIIILLGLIVLIIFVGGLFMFSNNKKSDKEYKVTFYKTQDIYCDCIDCNCINGPIKIITLMVREGEKVNIPEDPVYVDHEFVEWQLDGKKYDFDTPVTKDMELYTAWKIKIGEGKTHKVTFYQTQDYYCNCINCDCATGPIPYLSIDVKDGEMVTMPDTPIYEGHEFVEWQLDGVAYDFNAPVTRDIDLYTTWQTTN